MAYLPQFENDIYISYASDDNFNFAYQFNEGWIDLFYQYLGVELSRRIGRLGAIKAWRKVRGDEEFNLIIKSAIEESALFIAVTSDAYFSSDFCLKELNTFYGSAGTTRVGNHSRVFFVEFEPVPRARWPEHISNHEILSYPFFDQDQNLNDQRFPADPRSEIFQKQIKVLARDIIRVLDLLRDVSPAEVQAGTESVEPVEPVEPAKSAIFISYRRGEGTPYAGRLYDGLATHFGEDRVFMDLDTIEPGDDFVEVITNYVSSCSVLIALIHKTWLDAKDDEGRPRLANPEDFVHIEITTALQRNIRVIPVLVQGASMPRSQDLPESLSILSRRNALELSDNRWRSDVSKLIKVLEKHL
jgi:hypothetical protein